MSKQKNRSGSIFCGNSYFKFLYNASVTFENIHHCNFKDFKLQRRFFIFSINVWKSSSSRKNKLKDITRAAVVHLNFRAGSTFLVPVCTVPSSMDRTSRYNKVGTVRLYASYRLNLRLLKGRRCVLMVYCNCIQINRIRNLCNAIFKG